MVDRSCHKPDRRILAHVRGLRRRIRRCLVDAFVYDDWSVKCTRQCRTMHATANVDATSPGGITVCYIWARSGASTRLVLATTTTWKTASTFLRFGFLLLTSCRAVPTERPDWICPACSGRRLTTVYQRRSVWNASRSVVGTLATATRRRRDATGRCRAEDDYARPRHTTRQRCVHRVRDR